jgi:hypothetical protein
MEAWKTGSGSEYLVVEYERRAMQNGSENEDRYKVAFEACERGRGGGRR